MILEAVKYDDVLGEDGVSEGVQKSGILAHISDRVNSIIQANRRLALRHQERIVNGRQYIDTQALNAGVVDSIVSGVFQSEHSLVIQDYVRGLEKSHLIRGNVVAVVPLTEAVENNMLRTIRGRSDVQAVIVYTYSGVNVDFKRDDQKPAVLYVSDQWVNNRYGSLNDAIDAAITSADLDKQNVRTEIIYPGSYVSYIVKDILRLGKSITSMIRRSLRYVKQMVL